MFTTNPLIPLVISPNTIWHPAVPHFNCPIPASSQHSIYFIGELYTADLAFMFTEDCLCTCIQVIHLEGLVNTTTVRMNCILQDNNRKILLTVHYNTYV